jgi:hypothetical protein
MTLHGKNKASEKTSFFPGRRGVPYMGAENQQKDTF